MDVELTTGLRNASFEALEKLVSFGHSDEFIASLYNVPVRIWKDWLAAHPQLNESVMRWRAGQNDKVAQALYNRAIGCKHKETAVKVKKNGDVELVEFDKHYPPDTTACLSWLKNRDPENWNNEKNNQVIEQNSTVNLNVKSAALKSRIDLLKEEKDREVIEVEKVNKKEEEERKALEEALF